MKLSIVVPVYNNDKYVAACLDSVLRQDCGEMEIICVDDGSTDGSSTILEEYRERDARVNVIRKKNTGYGDSVNQGIQRAKGEYIGILESDDFAADGAFRRIIDLAEEYNAEVVKGNYYLYSEGSEPVLYDNLKAVQDESLLSLSDIRNLFYIAPSIWSAVYRRDFLLDHQIAFLPTPGAAYQDTSFAFKIWVYAQRVVTLKDGIIYYRTDNSLSSSNENNKVFDICGEFHEIEETIRKENRSDLWPIFARVKYISYLWNVNRLAPEQKVQFLDHVYDELMTLRNQDWLIRDIWSDSDWAVLCRILDRFFDYKEDLLKGKMFWEAGV